MVRTQVLKHLPGERKSERGGSKRDVRGGAMYKGGCVRAIEGEEVRIHHPIEYFHPVESEVPLESQRA